MGFAVVDIPGDIENKLYAAEVKHGLPHGYLITLASNESNFSNSAMNVDGVSFFFDNEHQAIRSLYLITKNPYLVQFTNEDGTESKYFAKSESHALLKSQEYQSLGFSVKKFNGNSFKKLNTISTDVCILQINNAAHIRDNFKSINEALDIDTCIEYGAKYLKYQINKHGLKNGVGCYHNCYIGEKHHSGYIERFVTKYQLIFNKPPF